MKIGILKRHLLVVAVAFGAANSANAQNLEWAQSFGGSMGDYGHSIAVDNSGNVYSTGYFNGTVDFDPGPGTSNLTSAGDYDIYVSKLDASGNFVWAKRFGSTDYDRGSAITVDASGNVLVTGSFSGTVDFNPGTLFFNLTSAGNRDAFVLKLNASGNFVWAVQIGGGYSDGGAAIAVDAGGNVYTTGYFQDVSDFDPGAGSFELTSLGNSDIFVSKLDASGNFIWASQYGGVLDNYPSSIAVDAAGNVYSAGSFQGVVDFDPGSGTFNLNSSGAYDAYVAVLTSTGDLLWAKNFGANGDEVALSIALDGSGNVYTTGSFQGTVDFDPGVGTSNLTSAGPGDVFVSKLDGSGNFVWAKQIGGTLFSEGYSIALDADNNIYIAGYFRGTADFDPGAGTFELTSAGGRDIFICKLDELSDFIWAVRIGGATEEWAASIAVDGNNNIYTTGSFTGTVDFDPFTGTQNLTSAGGYDIFVLKQSLPVSTLSPEEAKHIKVFPNPSNGLLQIETEKQQICKVYTSLGHIVFSFDLRAGTNLLQLPELSGGMYFISLQSESGTYVERLLIQH